jgi:hypothetical protein
MTYLLAGGCSFTDASFYPPEAGNNYPKWPALLAKKLNISKTVNTGMAGGSNEHMFGSVFDNVLTSKPKVVALLMTSWDRVTPYGYCVNPFEVAELLIEKKYPSGQIPVDTVNTLLDHGRKEWLLSHYVIKYHMTMAEIINSNLRMLYALQEVCKDQSIDLLVAQAFDPIRYSATTKLRRISLMPHDPKIGLQLLFPRTVLNSVYFNKIDWDKICIGGPFFKEINGQCMNDIIWKHSTPELREQLWIPIDGHPSAKGHEAIAQIFYDEYKKRYV